MKELTELLWAVVIFLVAVDIALVLGQLVAHAYAR
jgi:hypothetical protein